MVLKKDQADKAGYSMRKNTSTRKHTNMPVLRAQLSWATRTNKAQQHRGQKSDKHQNMPSQAPPQKLQKSHHFPPQRGQEVLLL
jgi:hypothetical protein